MNFMTYRPEIDSLRAIAVLSVILFHAGFETFSGGFIGVDIFFVISGYLITSIILKEKSAGTFTLANFYERRIRRILPALFFMLIVCIPAAWFWLLPHELKDFGYSVAAVSLFGSNFLFWQQSDYFSADAELIPLLHTWTLAVEEQYYLLFPLLLIVLWQFGKKSITVILALIAIASLIFSEWAWRHHPEFNFYLLPSRAWELLAGALCAFYLHNRANSQPTQKPIWQQILAALGLAMLCYAIFFFDQDLPYPSLITLIPILGSVLFICFSHASNGIGKWLSFRPIVWIGLISYSAYLWHYPIFAFTRLQSLEEPSLLLMSGLSVLTLLIAFLSWQFVEQPFRRKRVQTNTSQQTVFIVAGIASLLFIIAGLLLPKI